ncbi:DUF2784 domain-containing protein [Nocardiopsis sp. LOL_012]|uniref:DUF2784 domain-containing protein n=1 Tax=Nocardiopsis sp. LOL_012 TaxID=3345409 RepID=UPI003A884023
MIYHIVGEAAMALHMAFILYVALGGFLAWKWPRTFWLHLCVALYGLAISIVGWICPLTYVENWGRLRAGQEGLDQEGFIAHYLTGVIYPEDQLVAVQVGVGAVVALSWAGLAVLVLRRRRAAAQDREPDHTPA